MSKGDAPRNCFSKEWFSNYDDIDWTGSITTITPGISTVQGDPILEGIIRQTLDIPLPDCGCPDDQSNNNQKDCCAD